MSPPKNDPIFAAIERHRKALAALDEFDRSTDDTADEVFRPHLNREWKAEVEFAETIPTTIPGLLAMLTYIDEVIAAKKDPDTFTTLNRYPEPDVPIRPIFETLAAAARALAKSEARA